MEVRAERGRTFRTDGPARRDGDGLWALAPVVRKGMGGKGALDFDPHIPRRCLLRPDSAGQGPAVEPDYRIIRVSTHRGLQFVGCDSMRLGSAAMLVQGASLEACGV